jgi:putative inorganic carbon (hco3(-)) transporter
MVVAGISRQGLLWAALAALTGAVVAGSVAVSPLVAIALPILLAGAVVVVQRPDVILLVMVAALPWENKLGYPSPTISLIKLIGAVTMLAYLIKVMRNSRTKIHLPLLVGVVIAFFLWVGLSLVTSTDPAYSVQKMLRYTLFIAFFFLVIQLVDGRAGIERVMRWFTVSVAFAAVYGIYDFVSSGVGRAAGPVQDPNDFAYLLAVTLPICGYLIVTEARRRIVWSVAFALIAGSMLATFSRGALVGLGVLLAWGVITRRIPVWAILTGLAATAVVVALAFTIWKPLIDQSLQQKEHIAGANTTSRKVYWSVALTLTARHPFTGVGPDRYPIEAPPLIENNPILIIKPVTHNSYLEILSEDGIPALLLFLVSLALSWRALRKAERRAIRRGDIERRRLATAFQASLIVAVVSATFLSEQLTSPLWMLPALAVVLARREPRPATAEEPPREAEPAKPPAAPPPRSDVTGGQLVPV